jgi:hypothetical protein
MVGGGIKFFSLQEEKRQLRVSSNPLLQDYLFDLDRNASWRSLESAQGKKEEIQVTF